MERFSLFKFIPLTLAFLLSTTLFSQENDDTSDSEGQGSTHKNRFLTGIYVGSYFANKYTANTYDGYGFDQDGNRNTFTNSYMYQKIINEYGGGYGQRDLIADALGVDQKQWTFNESDMPFNMRYTPAILVGANFKIPLSARNSILVNVNGTKLNIEGNFTIGLIKPNNPNPALNNNIQNFAIRGGEQRLLFQLGYQQIFGEDEKFNFFIEGGLNGTLVKFDKNLIYINNLPPIDLTYYVNQTLNPAPFPARRPLGFAVGAFFGLGVNIDVSDKFNVQLAYTPSLEKVNIGSDPKLKLQHAIGLRVYYKLLKSK
jgi:hypothetical protein